MKKLRLVNIGELGSVLSSRDTGRAAGEMLDEAAEKGSFVVGFDGVEIATPSFLDELARRLAGLLHRNESHLVLIAGLNEEVRHSFELVVRDRGLRFAELRDDQIELLGGSDQLQQTLRKAQELGSFKAGDLARELEIKLPNLHQRLAALLEAGAISREPDPTAERGRRHSYKTATAEDLELVVA